MNILIPMLIVFVGMYFIMLRPQKKQQQARQNLLSAMKQGDKIVTIGGLHGVIYEVNSEANTIIIDCEGIYLEFDRNAIKTVMPIEDETNTNVSEEVTNANLSEDTDEVIEMEETPNEEKEN